MIDRLRVVASNDFGIHLDPRVDVRVVFSTVVRRMLFAPGDWGGKPSSHVATNIGVGRLQRPTIIRSKGG
jgi:hypothetical protein